VPSNEIYVDDLLSGTSTIQDAIKVQQETSSLLQTAGFPLKIWASYHSKFLDDNRSFLQDTQQTLTLDNEDGARTLGLLWNPTNYHIQVKNNTTQVQTSQLYSKQKNKGASHYSMYI